MSQQQFYINGVRIPTAGDRMTVKIWRKGREQIPEWLREPNKTKG